MKKLLFIIITLSLISCSQETQKKDLRIIDLEGNVGKSREALLSEVATSIEYIPLETTVEAILGPPQQDILIYENNLLFVLQKDSGFKIFDSEGTYLMPFNKRGNGPKEYLGGLDIVINNNADTISISSFKNILEYTKEGEYIRTINFPVEESLQSSRYSKLNKIGTNYYVLSTEILSYRSNLNFSAIIIDTASRVVLKIKYPEKEKEFVRELPLTHNISTISPSFFTFKNNVRIINGNDENIISVNENLKIDTVYILNYGKYHIRNFSNSRMIKSENKPFFEIFKSRSFFESSSYLFMQFRTGSLPFKKRSLYNFWGEVYSVPISCSFFNKKTGQFTFIDPCSVNEYGLIDDLEGGPAFWPFYISDDDYMVSYMEAHKFIEYALNHKVSDKFKKIAEGLKETDNLVLIRVKLK